MSESGSAARAGRLAGQAAIVTGAASGIGRVIALRFAQEGSSVAVADLNEAGAIEVAQEISARGGSAVAVRVDVSDANAVAAMTRSVLEAFGRVSLLVNCAGIVMRNPLEQTSDEEWARELAVDLTSVFACTRALAPHLRAGGGGCVINIASVAGMVGAVSAAYTAAKGGVIALSRQLAGELAPHRIRVNSVSPGFIKTPLSAKLRASGLEDAIAQHIPLRCWGTPEDVAGACVYLASDDARYVTGANLVVDGGLSGFLDLGEAYRSFDGRAKVNPN